MTPGEIYTESRRRLTDLARGLTPEQLETRTAACPDWTVKQVIAHLVGGVTDLLNGRFPSGELNDWTAEHVAARDDRSIDELLDEWDRIGPKAADAIDEEGSRLQILAIDIFTHEQDVRGALNEPGERDGAAADYALQRLVAGLGSRIKQNNLPALRVQSGKDEWLLGEGEPGVSTKVDGFELLRALIGRRSEQQVRAWEWSGDPSPYIPHLSPFPLATSSITE